MKPTDEEANSKKSPKTCTEVPVNELANTSTAVTLKDMTDILSTRRLEARCKKLLSEVGKLREWSDAAAPTHKQRDAMIKLGKDWHVPQRLHGKKRNPADVAKDLEQQFIAIARRLLVDNCPLTIYSGAAEPTHEVANLKKSNKTHTESQSASA